MNRHGGRIILTTAAATALTLAMAAAPTVAGATARTGGSASDWNFTNGTKKDGTSWNSCAVIDYRVNARLARRGATADVKEAVARIRAATGLRFRYLGATSTIPGDRRPGHSAAPAGEAPLVIAWSTPKLSDVLPRAMKGYRAPAGIGGSRYTWGYTTAGVRVNQITEGYVVLDTKYAATAGGFGTGPRYGLQGTRGQLLMHEIGHAVGLGHAAHDRRQIMYPMMSRKAATFGAGDLNGLRRLGARSGKGCLSLTNPIPPEPIEEEWTDHGSDPAAFRASTGGPEPVPASRNAPRLLQQLP